MHCSGLPLYSASRDPAGREIRVEGREIRVEGRETRHGGILFLDATLDISFLFVSIVTVNYFVFVLVDATINNRVQRKRNKRKR